MSLRHLRQFGHNSKIPLPADEMGLVGRECPNPECLGYFKIEPGTGLIGKNLPCHCPYCGHVASQDHFWTRDQIEYVRSVAISQLQNAVRQDIQERNRRWQQQSRHSFIKLSIEYKGQLRPIHYYREKMLETDVVCEQCTLHYAIYGVFGYCPDCGVHNSPQMLSKNLELAQKEISLAATTEDQELAAYLLADALENAVAAFDGFGREVCKIHAAKAKDPKHVEKISFQSLTRAEESLQKLFDIQMADSITPENWTFVVKCFQKRHLLAHKMGVVDEAYIKATGDMQAVAGRKVQITIAEVENLLQHLQKMGEYLAQQLAAL